MIIKTQLKTGYEKNILRCQNLCIDV